MKKSVIIASKNPVKVQATQAGFSQMLTDIDFDFEGVAVLSGVSDQPMSDGETLQGAKQRAMHAKEAYPDAHFWVGIEGGIAIEDELMTAFAWIVVIGKEGSGQAKTGTFVLPNKIANLVKEGKELGEADDLVFGKTNSKQKSGAVGLLTDDLIDRTSYYTQAVILALIPFRNVDLYYL